MNYHHKISLVLFNLFSFLLTAQELQNLSYKKISDLYAGYPDIRSNYCYLITDAEMNGNTDRYFYFAHQLLKAGSTKNIELAMRSSKILREYEKEWWLKESLLLDSKNHFYLFLVIPFGIILSICLLFFWRRIKERKITKKYNEILEKFYERESILKTEPIIDNKKEPYSPEIIEDIKVKLKKFEEDKLFLTKNLTLPRVAKMLGRNHSQLSYVLNEHLDISFTHYLKTLRIGYITNLLMENKMYLQYKVENLAQECGMSSRQLFSTHFFEINGIRPIDFIKNRMKEIGEN